MLHSPTRRAQPVAETNVLTKDGHCLRSGQTGWLGVIHVSYSDGSEAMLIFSKRKGM